jgi:hypothetical protein
MLSSALAGAGQWLVLAHNIYLLDLPLMIVLTSLVYSATRFDRWPTILHETGRWVLRLGGFIFAVTAVLYLVNRF